MLSEISLTPMPFSASCGGLSTLSPAMAGASSSTRRISALTILPPGPEPTMAFKSRLFVAAMDRARGEALMRPFGPTDEGGIAAGWPA